MRLLQVAGTLDPAYGGPCVVVNQLTRSLIDLGHSVDVITLDPPSAPWLTDLPGSPRAFGPGLGKYGYTRHLRPWLQRHAPGYDAVTVHGIWQYQSQAVRAACRKAGVPYFLFVHGALDPWFRERYPGKHAKKALYWRLFEHRTLRDARAVLYTCEEERRLARTAFTPYHAREAIVGLGIEEPHGNPALQREAFLSANPHLRDKRLLLFLGRLHPKKGCDLLIEAFSRVCDRDESLHLVVAGPDESGSEAGLRALAESRGVTGRITWTGMLNGDAKWGAYRAADAFVLPSHSENFGVVVAEALACGLPVLISDKVNIWREIERCGAGLVDGDTVAGAASLLNRWMDLSDAGRAEMRRRARACFLENFEARGAALGFVTSIAGAIGKAGAA
ncbi:glycosyltransferase [Mycobacterium sp. 663a-19]|uniref:glycosyltransferase n=1 Tax=Mycobacterium sp. 663a-19 TaxID=2986148 RepID=UPI002D1E8745|nr:glycosyltransferase [Mycobacterium sp. 663a-19]MEB3980330.1 glycosyltransferase [Mycobacterium sp. 663a-19]